MSRQAIPDLAQRLESEGVGTVGTTIFQGRLPDQPDEAIAIRTYPGDASRLHGNANLPADERLNAQILIRGARDDTSSVATLADSVYDAIAFRHATLTSGRRYDWCRANHVPTPLRQDDNDRPVWVLNVTLKRARTDV